MNRAATLRIHVESALASRIPSALSPRPRVLNPVVPTGIAPLDALLGGGVPLGAITEFVGQECSGRTAVALSFAAQVIAQEKVCAWIDVSDTFSPEAAAAAGVFLPQLLWVRCGRKNAVTSPYGGEKFALPQKYMVPPPQPRGLHGGGFGPHPRNEAKGLSQAVTHLFHEPATPAPQTKFLPQLGMIRDTNQFRSPKPLSASRRLSRIEQALRVTDLLLQAGWVGAIIFDMGSITPELVTRVPAATWFRYRTAAERTQTSFLLLSQHACTKSSAELVLNMKLLPPFEGQRTIFTGVQSEVEIVRERFSSRNALETGYQKPPASERRTYLQNRPVWTATR